MPFRADLPFHCVNLLPPPHILLSVRILCRIDCLRMKERKRKRINPLEKIWLFLNINPPTITKAPPLFTESNPRTDDDEMSCLCSPVTSAGMDRMSGRPACHSWFNWRIINIYRFSSLQHQPLIQSGGTFHQLVFQNEELLTVTDHWVLFVVIYNRDVSFRPHLKNPFKLHLTWIKTV